MNALLTSYCVNDFKIVLYELEIWIRLSDTEYVIRFFLAVMVMVVKNNRYFEFEFKLFF